jgi:hypothetical protein
MLTRAGHAGAGEPGDTGGGRVRAGSQVIWIASEDLHSAGGASARARVLWTTARGANLPAGTRYTVSDYAFACDGGVHEQVHAYDAAGRPLPDRAPAAAREVRGGIEGAVFAMVCQGAEWEDDVELGSAREVMDYEAAGHGAPARPANRWNSGPSAPDDEPVEEQEPGAPSDDNGMAR